jgi:hypothetical protein
MVPSSAGLRMTGILGCPARRSGNASSCLRCDCRGNTTTSRRSTGADVGQFRSLDFHLGSSAARQGGKHPLCVLGLRLLQQPAPNGAACVVAATDSVAVGEQGSVEHRPLQSVDEGPLAEPLWCALQITPVVYTFRKKLERGARVARCAGPSIGKRWSPWRSWQFNRIGAGAPGDRQALRQRPLSRATRACAPDAPPASTRSSTSCCRPKCRRAER